MSTKKLTSANSGSYKDINNIDIDIQGGVLSSSMQVSTDNLTINNTSGLLNVINGQLSEIDTSTAQMGDALKYNGSSYVSTAVVASQFGGDLSGSLDNVKVTNISNVNTGILSSSYGGTGTGSFPANSIVTTNGGVLDASQADQIIAIDAAGNLTLQSSSLVNFTPMTGTIVYLYTSNGSWTKPAGCRFIRVICQGGGGGGAGGRRTSTSPYGGGGGGGGGYSDITLNGISFPSSPIAITIGSGGPGGNVSGGQNGAPGSSGGVTSFGSYILAYGGNGGNVLSGGNVGGSGGIGYTANGAAGGGSGTTGGNGVSGGSINGVGAPGGGSGGANNAPNGGSGGSKNGLSASGGIGTSVAGQNAQLGIYFVFNSYILNGIIQNNLLSISSSGAGGGGGGAYGIAGGNGGSGAYGTGGGGGGGKTSSGPAAVAGNGGPGGAGYVLIICY